MLNILLNILPLLCTCPRNACHNIDIWCSWSLDGWSWHVFSSGPASWNRLRNRDINTVWLRCGSFCGTWAKLDPCKLYHTCRRWRVDQSNGSEDESLICPAEIEIENLIKFLEKLKINSYSFKLLSTTGARLVMFAHPQVLGESANWSKLEVTS